MRRPDSYRKYYNMILEFLTFNNKMFVYHISIGALNFNFIKINKFMLKFLPSIVLLNIKQFSVT